MDANVTELYTRIFCGSGVVEVKVHNQGCSFTAQDQYLNWTTMVTD